MMSDKIKRALFRILLILLKFRFVILQVEPNRNSQCLVTNDDSGPPSFPGPGYGDSGLDITQKHQAIFTSYRMNCCGNITGWGIDVNSGAFVGSGNDRSGQYSLDFQVWRPSPTVNNSTGTGCYSLVGNNRFTSISPIVSPGVARVTPSPQDYIPFQPGDVLGVFVEDASLENDGVVILTSHTFNSDNVWYASIDETTSQNGGCPYSVGSNGGVLNTFLRGAPVISIQTNQYSCPEPGPGSGPGSSTFSREGAITVAVVVTALVVMLIATVAIVVIVLRLKRGTKQGISNPAYGTQSHEQAQSNANNYDYIHDESVVPTATVTPNCKPKVAAKNNKRVADRNINHRMYDLEETELYHKIGPSAVDGGATGIAETRVSHREVDRSTPQHIYRYLENNLSRLAGASRTSERSPAHKGSSSQINQNHGPASYEIPQPQEAADLESDVFDRAGIYVPTPEERADWTENHYELNEPQIYNKLKFFVEDQIYWAPASTTSDLYSQLASKKYREIPRNQIIVRERLGSGQFGEVHKAVWSISGTTKELAIKTLKPGANDEEKVKILQEAAIMGQFFHPNIVKLYGVVTVGEPIMVCIELMVNGDLSWYLRSITPDKHNQEKLKKQFLQFSQQIASGMKYLSMKSFVHRDLAARNVLLDRCFTCKIGDFGLARDLMDETYYTPKASAGMIPVKWTAPEALLYKKYSTDSDVWSYGMVLFEIWSVGKKPFSNFNNVEVLKLIQTGLCQPPPPECPRAIYKLMVDCWNMEHQDRPSFEEIYTYLKQPAAKLLHWSQQDAAVSVKASHLGAGLEEAAPLYIELQDSYAHYEAV